MFTSSSDSAPDVGKNGMSIVRSKTPSVIPETVSVTPDRAASAPPFKPTSSGAFSSFMYCAY